MKPMIEHPHIFISYAWGTNEYQSKVIGFARSLMDVGIKVELDKWSLKEGNDTYAFMEQMVNNPEITNVLILLDKNYEEKANERKGGVGTETQIISPEIYEKVKQDKFIPVVFERGIDGEIYKPTFLKGLLHFDLSLDENYNTEFQRLVKRLFGVDIIKKPELGNRPDWVTKDDTYINPRIVFSKIFSASNEKERKYEIGRALSGVANEMLDIISRLDFDGGDYIELYKNIQEYRNKILALVGSCIWVDSLPNELSSFLETIKNKSINKDRNNEAKETLLHETFIYVVGMFYKAKNYDALGYLLNKTYFSSNRLDGPSSFDVFYYNNNGLDSIVCQRDNKRYYCGTAQLWVETINLDYLTINEFVVADIILYNVAVFGKNYQNPWWWFPVTYVYDNLNHLIEDFGKRMVSKEHIEEVSKIFGYSKSEEFVSSIKAALDNAKDRRNRYRYPGAWNDAPLITDYFEINQIGKLN